MNFWSSSLWERRSETIKGAGGPRSFCFRGTQSLQGNFVTLQGKNRALIWPAKEVLPGGLCMYKPKSYLVPVVLVALACAFVALPAMAESQARIVRLSDVQGSVAIDKNPGVGFDRAFLNLPTTQGRGLRTTDSGRTDIYVE